MSKPTSPPPKNPQQSPLQPTTEEQKPLPLGDDASALADAPGVDELRKLAEDEPAPEAAPDPASDLPPPVVVTLQHRILTQTILNTAFNGLEGVLPIKYSEPTREQGVEVWAPVVAKHADLLPLWFLKYQEEIIAGSWTLNIAVKTAREVARINAMELEIRELAKEYRDKRGLAAREARRQAIAELGYDEQFPDPRRAEAEGATT